MLLERACSPSAHAEANRRHDWYDDISDALIKEQRSDGSWSEAGPGRLCPPIRPSVLLFLSWATAKLIKHAHPMQKCLAAA